MQAGARYKELLLDTPVYIRSRVEFEIAGVQTQCGCWTEYVNLPPAIGPLLLALVRVLTAIIRWNNRCYRLAGRMLG